MLEWNSDSVFERTELPYKEVIKQFEKEVFKDLDILEFNKIMEYEIKERLRKED